MSKRDQKKKMTFKKRLNELLLKNPVITKSFNLDHSCTIEDMGSNISITMDGKTILLPNILLYNYLIAKMELKDK